MPGIYVSTLVLDVADMKRALRFWSDALGYVTSYESDEFSVLKHPTDKLRVRVGFQPADGAKPPVNAIHLDLATDDMAREAARLEALGATRARDWPYPEGEVNWIVMRDPDGHEFCVVQHPPERLLFRD